MTGECGTEHHMAIPIRLHMSDVAASGQLECGNRAYILDFHMPKCLRPAIGQPETYLGKTNNLHKRRSGEVRLFAHLLRY